MASVMLATYPEVFAGGAIIAGLPYGCARSVQQAFDAMFTEQSPSAHALGDRVRAASGHRGPWPKISVWHGTADPIVKPSNAENIVSQWIDVHGLAAAFSYEKSSGSHTPGMDRRRRRCADRGVFHQRHGAWCAARVGDGGRILRLSWRLLSRRRNFLHASHRPLLAVGRRLNRNTAARNCDGAGSCVQFRPTAVPL